MAEARDDLDRFDRVLGSAEAISDAVDGGSRVARACAEHAGHQDGRSGHGYVTSGAAACGARNGESA